MTEIEPKHPRCFGSIEVRRPQSRAENGCDDCPHETECAKHPPADMAGLDGMIEHLKGTAHQAATELQALAARVKVLEAENERLRRDDWFEQFEEQEQLRDNAEQRLSIVEAENERLRQKLELIAYGMTIELDDEDGPVQVWLDADELSDIARAALKGNEQ